MHDQNMAQGGISIFSLYNIFSTYICIIYLQHNDNVVSQHLRESPSGICGVAWEKFLFFKNYFWIKKGKSTG